MARKIAWFLVLLAAAVPAVAQRTGAISGQVRDSAGVPQMGAVVKVFSGVTQIASLFTDAQGFYSAHALAAGTYQVRASAPSFLPSQRENLSLKAGAHLVVNLTLNTLFEAVQMLPPRKRTAEDDENWKWTLRSAANRPVLRVLDDGPLVVVSKGENGSDRSVKARVAFMAGSASQGFGSSSDMSTAFRVETSLFSAGTVSVGGNVGYGAGTPAVLHAAYAHDFGNGSQPEVAVTLRRFANPDSVMHNAALQALAVALSDRTTILDVLELRYGAEMQSIQFMGHVTTARPFGSAALHLGPNTTVEYRYASAQPNGRMEKGFETAPADLSESGPRLSLVGGMPRVEKARHQELAVSRRMGRTSVQLAAFTDRVRNTALMGAGAVNDTTAFLPDVYSDTFTYNGGNLATRGLRAVVEEKILPDFTATLDYSMGGALTLQQADLRFDQLPAALRMAHHHALAAKLAGRVPGSKTRIVASYKWTNGTVVTPVDMFNASAGQADPYFSIFVRQPIPGGNFLPGKMEALIDVRNLLAQGYVPVVAQDGRTLYLVQSARALRGGLAFTF